VYMYSAAAPLLLSAGAYSRSICQTRRPPLLLSIDGTDGLTDGRTPDRYLDPAPHTPRSAATKQSEIVIFEVSECWNVTRKVEYRLAQRWTWVQFFTQPNPTQPTMLTPGSNPTHQSHTYVKCRHQRCRTHILHVHW